MKLILLHKWLTHNKLDIIEIDDNNARIMTNIGIAKTYNENLYQSLKEKEYYEFTGTKCVIKTNY
jgi:hypothetical protein